MPALAECAQPVLQSGVLAGDAAVERLDPEFDEAGLVPETPDEVVSVRRGGVPGCEERAQSSSDVGVDAVGEQVVLPVPEVLGCALDHQRVSLGVDVVDGRDAAGRDGPGETQRGGFDDDPARVGLPRRGHLELTEGLLDHDVQSPAVDREHVGRDAAAEDADVDCVEARQHAASTQIARQVCCVRDSVVRRPVIATSPGPRSGDGMRRCPAPPD